MPPTRTVKDTRLTEPLRGQPTAEEEKARAEWAAAKQKGVDQLATATAAEDDAVARLAALRERHQSAGDVTATEFSDAVRARTEAEDHRKGAEEFAGAAGYRERLEVLRTMRDAMESAVRPERAAELFERAADAFGDLLIEIGPLRAQAVRAWYERFHQAGVPVLRGNEKASADDLGIGLKEPGHGSGESVIWSTGGGKNRSVTGAFNWEQILAAMVTRAARKAGMNAHSFGVSTSRSDAPLVNDPESWFRARG
jgi:hypothetical protein